MKLSKNTRIFGCILIIISVALLFTAWIETYGETKSFLSSYSSDIESLVDEVSGEVSWALMWFDVNVDEEMIRDVCYCLTDGELSAKEIGTVCRGVSSIMTDLIRGEFESESFSFDSDDWMIWTIVITVLYRLIFLVAIVSGVIAFINRFKGYSSRAEYFFAGSYVVMLVAMIVLIAYAKSSEDLDIALRITYIPFVATILAMPSGMLEKLPLDRINLGFVKDDALDNVAAKTKQTLKNVKNTVILPKDGSMNQTPQNICPACQSVVKSGNAFCGNCGSRVENVKRTCPECNKELDENSRYCEHCGRYLGG